MRRPTALALLTLCSATALSGCEPKRIVTNLKPPTARLVCVAGEARPAIPGEYKIDWNSVRTVPQAKLEHDKYVQSIRSREGVISGYILRVEGRLFACSNNMEWLRNWYKGQP